MATPFYILFVVIITSFRILSNVFGLYSLSPYSFQICLHCYALNFVLSCSLPPTNPVSATHVVLDVRPSTGAGQPTLGNLQQEN